MKNQIMVGSIIGLTIAVFLFIESVSGLLLQQENKKTSVKQSIIHKYNDEKIVDLNHFKKGAIASVGVEYNKKNFIEVGGIHEYIEVVDGCGPYFEGACLNARSGAGVDHGVVMQFRNGMVLKVASAVDVDGETWYKIKLDEQILYPARIKNDLHVKAEYVRMFLNEGELTLENIESVKNTKRIIVNRKKQMLYAYDEDELFMQTHISTGLALTPTPRGTFTIFKKTPSRYMQGPLPGIAEQYYDLPGVPWNLYFTNQGAVIHGAYWHNEFGKPWSHGCINVPLGNARELYIWADLGTQVIVQD